MPPRLFSCLPLAFLILSLQENPQLQNPTPLHRHEAQRTLMGTTVRIVLYAPDKTTADHALETAFARIADLEQVMSDYDPESELSQLNSQAGQGQILVSPDLFRILATAQDLARKTSGAFDPTVGPLVRQWRRAFRNRQMPTPKNLAQALALTGYQNVLLDPQQQTASLAKPGMKLDLGGIGKGFAADEALQILRDLGLPRALVAIAGDVVTGEPPPHAVGWKVEIASPLGLDQPRLETLLLANQAVSSSGDLERFVEILGTRYSHIVNPRTGLGVVDRAQATVVAPSGTLADALATTLFVLGPDAGLNLLQTEFPQTAALHLRVKTASPPLPHTLQNAHTPSWSRIPRLGPSANPLPPP
jgi:thiamine biosynthesis lipoprotein